MLKNYTCRGTTRPNGSRQRTALSRVRLRFGLCLKASIVDGHVASAAPPLSSRSLGRHAQETRERRPMHDFGESASLSRHLERYRLSGFQRLRGRGLQNRDRLHRQEGGRDAEEANLLQWLPRHTSLSPWHCRSASRGKLFRDSTPGILLSFLL